eukprot:109579-Amphidinium_carterae.1
MRTTSEQKRMLEKDLRVLFIENEGTLLGILNRYRLELFNFGDTELSLTQSSQTITFERTEGIARGKEIVWKPTSTTPRIAPT